MLKFYKKNISSFDDINKYANEVIPVIRKNSPKSLIIVGTPNWSQDVDRVVKLGFDNIMYGLHFYSGTHTEDLRNKESDRIKCLVSELVKIGINIIETADGFIVEGKTKIKGGAELETYHDHRLAMTFYIAGLIAEQEIAINGFEWTKISFPEFEELIANLE